MAAEQTAPELTTRDVLLQVDRRLSLIEEDVRSLDGKVDTRAETLVLKIDTGLGELRKEINTKFLWVLGAVLASWVSTLGTVLFK